MLPPLNAPRDDAELARWALNSHPTWLITWEVRVLWALGAESNPGWRWAPGETSQGNGPEAEISMREEKLGT